MVSLDHHVCEVGHLDQGCPPDDLLPICFLQPLLLLKGLPGHLDDNILDLLMPDWCNNKLRLLQASYIKYRKPRLTAFIALKALDLYNPQFAELLTFLCKVSLLHRNPNFSAHTGYLFIQC